MSNFPQLPNETSSFLAYFVLGMNIFEKVTRDRQFVIFDDAKNVQMRAENFQVVNDFVEHS